MCRALIDPALMTNDEIAWVDALHARCREEITEELLLSAALKGRCGADGAEADAKAAKAWLLSATEPLRGANVPVRARAVAAVLATALETAKVAAIAVLAGAVIRASLRKR